MCKLVRAKCVRCPWHCRQNVVAIKITEFLFPHKLLSLHQKILNSPHFSAVAKTVRAVAVQAV